MKKSIRKSISKSIVLAGLVCCLLLAACGGKSKIEVNDKGITLSAEQFVKGYKSNASEQGSRVKKEMVPKPNKNLSANQTSLELNDPIKIYVTTTNDNKNITRIDLYLKDLPGGEAQDKYTKSVVDAFRSICKTLEPDIQQQGLDGMATKTQQALQGLDGMVEIQREQGWKYSIWKSEEIITIHVQLPDKE